MNLKNGIAVELTVGNSLGLMSVMHDGSITCDDLQTRFAAAADRAAS